MAYLQEKAYFEKVTYRYKPCNCGCGGADWWHKSTYKRKVRGVRPEKGRARTRDNGEMEFKRIGWVRLPFSTKPVRVVDVNRWTDSAWWCVDYDSIVFDK